MTPILAPVAQRKSAAEFVRRFNGVAKERVELARYSTMKVGGVADVLAVAETGERLIEAVRLAHELGLRYIVLAGGSNLLFTDQGFRGVVVYYTAQAIALDKALGVARIEAGCGLNQMVTRLAAVGWGGVTFLANIPGSLGGAVVGNAGCYGKDISELLVGARLWNVLKNKEEYWQPGDFGFAYRHSRLKEQEGRLVLEVVLRVVPAKEATVLAEMQEEKEMRLRKHPQQPSCGSFFKNPQRGIAAWRFIEQAGLKGITMGGARVSNKHANHIVNIGQASSDDVLNLARWVKKTVREKTGVDLIPEVRIVDEVGSYIEI